MEYAFLALLAALVAFWVDTLRAREAAVAAGRGACDRVGVQFLDDTVAACSFRPERSPEGWPVARRRYRFEFCDAAGTRRDGRVELVGARVLRVELDPYAPEERVE